jgi:uncharacterized membrane protein YheB (UPF0754 family)
MTLADILVPLIAALIGWFTNYIAVKMLFRPRTPVRILGMTLHGLVPKRQRELAEKIGETVSTSLVSHDDITEVLRSPEVQARITEEVEGEIDSFLQKFVGGNPMVAMFLQGESFTQVRALLVQQLQAKTPVMLEHVVETVEQKVDFKKIVQQKIESFDLGQLEDLIYRVSAQELKTIELLGGVLGFLVGLLQVAVMKLV